ncbi:hypothetical protein [Arsenophonus apicola]|nr:hypothetical protein [Arsenophonus apicola]UBX29840.1 hypothetical protein LDL57_04085 [Arsenophonus apicola]
MATFKKIVIKSDKQLKIREKLTNAMARIQQRIEENGKNNIRVHSRAT